MFKHLLTVLILRQPAPGLGSHQPLDKLPGYKSGMSVLRVEMPQVCPKSLPCKTGKEMKRKAYETRHQGNLIYSHITLLSHRPQTVSHLHIFCCPPTKFLPRPQPPPDHSMAPPLYLCCASNSAKHSRANSGFAFPIVLVFIYRSTRWTNNNNGDKTNYIS